MSIAENLAEVQQRIGAAARRSGRSPEAVTLVAVSKYVSAELTSELVEAGCRELGEARPQELWRKAGSLSQPGIHWHLIGHLQTNKVRRTVPLVLLIQSIDSQNLLDVVNREAAALGRTIPVLLEVNISGDATKHGLVPDAVRAIVERSGEWPAVQIRGLMGMAALEGGIDVARKNFADLRNLRDGIAAAGLPGGSLQELSMGMSDDYEAAIEEGATIVRVGSALFEGI